MLLRHKDELLGDDQDDEDNGRGRGGGDIWGDDRWGGSGSSSIYSSYSSNSATALFINGGSNSNHESSHVGAIESFGHGTLRDEGHPPQAVEEDYRTRPPLLQSHFSTDL